MQFFIKCLKSALGVSGDGVVHMDISHLANTIDAVSRLRFFGWIPPAPIVDNVIGLDQCQTNARDIGREHDDVKARMLSKPLHYTTAGLVSAPGVAPAAGGTINNVNVYAELGPNDRGEELLHIESARKNEGLL